MIVSSCNFFSEFLITIFLICVLYKNMNSLVKRVLFGAMLQANSPQSQHPYICSKIKLSGIAVLM